MLAVRTGVADSSWEWHVGERWPAVASDLARERLVASGQGYVQADGDERAYLMRLGLDASGPVAKWPGHAGAIVLALLTVAASGVPPAPRAEPRADAAEDRTSKALEKIADSLGLLAELRLAEARRWANEQGGPGAGAGDPGGARRAHEALNVISQRHSKVWS